MKRLCKHLIAFVMVLTVAVSSAGAAFAEDGPAAAAIKDLTLTPGVNTTQVNLTWYADKEAGSVSRVKIAPKADVVNNQWPEDARVYNGTSKETYATDAKTPTGVSSHQAKITGLSPNTTYSYSVSSDGSTYSDVYTYKTPASDKFTFATIGDPQLTTGKQDSSSARGDQTTAAGWEETVNEIQSKGVDFIAGVGDQVDTTGNGKEAEYDNFFNPSYLRSVPFAPAVGNHDRHYPFLFHYNLPNKQTFDPELIGTNKSAQTATVEAAGNYYYSYNNALFVVLNTSGYPTSKEEAADKLLPRFRQTLEEAISSNPNYTWLFVQHHKSSASVADHIADTDIQYYVEAGIEKLMDQYKVDFVLSGHDHVYARSYPMNNGTPDLTGVNKNSNGSVTQGGDGAATATNPKGTVYLTTTTGSGLKYYELFNNAGNLYVKNNENYPYLVGGKKGSVAYAGANIYNSTSGKQVGGANAGADNAHEVGLLPLSTAKYMQNKTPGYLYITVEKSKVSFKFYDIDQYKDTPYDSYTVTKASTPPVVAKKSISKATISKISNLVYIGKARKPVPTVKYSGKTLKRNVDYTLSYGKNVAIGRGTITITGKGNYNGKKQVTFNILPKTVTTPTVTAGKKKMTIKWKRIPSNITKYQIQYKQSGTKTWKTKTVVGSKSALAITKLKKGKKYQVRIRACKTVSKVNYYGAWSKVRTSNKVK